MKFKEINLISYGKLINKTIKLESGINLIYGKNESGKTTIMKSIFDIIYGIYPIDRDKNKLVNWSNNRLELKANILDNNKEYNVSRRLESAPKGSLVNGNDIKVINNNTLEFAKDIPEYLYKDLYYLDLELLNNLNEKTWKKIDNKIIFSYGDTIIKNPDIVVDEINEKLSRIWRKTNRGKYRLKSINKELNDLNKKKRDLIKKYNETKYNIKELKQLEDSILKNEKDLKSKIKFRDKIEKVLPIANLVAKTQQLKESYDNFSVYKNINPDILQEISILEEKNNIIEERIEDTINEINTSKLKLKELSEKEVFIEKNIDKISLKLKEYETLLKEKNVLFENQSEEKIILEEYGKLFYKIFNEIYTDDMFNMVRNINSDDFIKNKVDNKKILISILSIFFGILIYNFNFFFISLIFLSLGISYGINILKNKKAKIKGFNNIKINNDSIIYFDKLKDLEFRYLNLSEKNKKLENELLLKESEIKEFFKTYNQIENLDFNVKIIKKIIEDIFDKKRNDDKYSFVIKKLTNNKEEFLKKQSEILSNLNNKKKSIMALGYETLDVNINCFNKNKEIDNKIRNINEEIELIDNSSLLIKEYNDSNILINDLELNLLNKEIDKLKDNISESKVKFTKLQGNIEKNKINNEINDIETDIELLKEEKESLIREKNKLILIREIIKKSNKEFKEENQPGIIKEANKLFNFFTDSKYDKIYIDEDTKEIFVKLDNYNKNINEGFSRGTIDQLYLSLKLALIKHYEKDYKLPIILDEVFANWDDIRINCFINSLKKVINRRQLIILTCKKEILNAFERMTDLEMNVIRIDGVINE